MVMAKCGLAPQAGPSHHSVSVGRDNEGLRTVTLFLRPPEERRKEILRRGSAIEFRNAASCSNVPFAQASKPRQRAEVSSSQFCLWPEQDQAPRTTRPEPR